jgi:hypothetical protein
MFLESLKKKAKSSKAVENTTTRFIPSPPLSSPPSNFASSTIIRTPPSNSRAIIEIYNLEGKLILRKENSFLQNEISTEGWAIGTYLVKIIGENNAVSRRILKY